MQSIVDLATPQRIAGTLVLVLRHCMRVKSANLLRAKAVLEAK